MRDMSFAKVMILCVFTFCELVSFSQAVINKLPAKRTTASFKIDGNLSEPDWKDAPSATDFIEMRPNYGAKENHKTDIRILYDNSFIYIGGYCYDSPDSISRELAGRDQVGNSDFVGVIFDTYYDKINAVGFYVTTTGEQYDAKYSADNNNGGEDASWNAVWESEAKIHKDGWSFEMKIPYSALRFTSKDNQEWGLNITRKRQKTTEQYFWNKVDPNVNGFVNQEGVWTGIEKIRSPLRLSFSPYLSVYANNYPYNIKGVKNTTTSVNGGMDIKYGISQSFTLDMTLIPDFGQVQSDNIVFNRTPFEIKYSENRSFFTEGTELFNKGNLFYSRRIGSRPINAGNVTLNENEQITRNPSESKLLNATKISGRTSKGLGVGVFNAITRPMYADIEDTITGKTRTSETGPLTNYNIFVLDQSLKNNSSASFINTNVMRSGTDYDANVSAAMFSINNKKNTWNWSGRVSTSSLFFSKDSTVTGYTHDFWFGKTGGKFNFFFEHWLVDDKYNYNDLGLMTNYNFLDHYLYLGYRLIKPTSWYNNLYLNFNLTYSRRFYPSEFHGVFWNVNSNGQLKNLAKVSVFLGYNSRGNDFYEPHKIGYFYRIPPRYMWDMTYNSNQAKKYSYRLALNMSKREINKNILYEISLNHQYRFNDKFALGFSTNYSTAKNDIGFADIDPNTSDVIFALRDLNTVENVISGKYNFNKRHGITLKVRHYWSETIARQLYTLQADGTLADNHTYTGDANQNFNVFNIDMIYTWEFAPGSFINMVYKNSATDFDQDISKDYFRNFGQTVRSPQNNNLSLKILYYLDYIKLKKNRH
jgi:hypothetical protein